mmetsp:Transcript_32211/g.67327  ORF Transcript_32211/g.67327 Transcript_32211/m.67327 type:complete len:271 (-) Transcript_32211:328-1140(-)
MFVCYFEHDGFAAFQPFAWRVVSIPSAWAIPTTATMVSSSFRPFNPVAMYTSRSLTRASYKKGATRCSCPMIVRTFSLVFIVSTKDVSSSLNCSSDISCPLPPPPASFSPIAALAGTIPSRVFSSSESGLSKAFRSVLASPSVTLRKVTSTSRSPRTMSAPSFFPSRTAVTNSSPESKPAESSREYKPLICLPTAAVAAFMMGLLLSFLGGALAAGRGDGDEEVASLSLVEDPGDADSDPSTSPPSPGTTEICGTMILDSRAGAGAVSSP